MASGGNTIGAAMKLRLADAAAAVLGAFEVAEKTAAKAAEAGQTATTSSIRALQAVERLAAGAAYHNKRLEVKNSCAAAQSCAHAPE